MGSAQLVAEMGGLTVGGNWGVVSSLSLQRGYKYPELLCDQ